MRTNPAAALAPAGDDRAGAVRAPEARALSILLVKRDKLGDLLLATPLFAALAAALPRARIDLLANDYNAWVVAGHPALRRVFVCPRTRRGGRLRIVALAAQWKAMRRVRRERFDFAIVLGGEESHRGIERAIASGAARVVAYAQAPERYGARLTDPLPPPSAGHEIVRMRALFGPLALPVSNEPLAAPAFALPPDVRAFATQWLAHRGLRERAYVVIGVGARRAKKQPTPAQVLRWSARLFALGWPTVFVWTPNSADDAGYPGDDALARDVLAHAGPFVHPFRGPFREALGLVHFARTTVVPDSGLMHFAAASPGGVLGLFADPADSSPAARWAPIGPRARFLEAERRVADLDDDAVFAVLAPLLDDPKR